jgi:hypothetical protein
MITNVKLKNETANGTKPVLVAVTPEMIKFAEEYALWIVTVGQNYINALSPKFTTESSMKIFIDNYYSKDWLEGRFK